MTSFRQVLGYWRENLAAKNLEKKGYIVLGQNIRTPFGEIDLVTRYGEILVFVEVKTSSTDEFGLPESSITDNKREHVVNNALSYLQSHPDFDGDSRIDVISIRKQKISNHARNNSF